MDRKTLISGMMLSIFISLFLSFGNAVAAGDFVGLSYEENGELHNCNYSASSSDQTSCKEGYGTYSSETKTVTLGAGVNSLNNVRLNSNIDGLTITANSNISLTNVYATSDSVVVLDFKSYTLSAASLGAVITDLQIKSGTYNLTHMYAYNYEMAGGNINLSSRPEVYGNIAINGGSLNINSENDILKSSGIFLRDGKNLTINDGNLTIDGFDWGISGSNNKLTFNGGSTIVKNSTTHSIWISPASDPENAIIFGSNTGMKEDAHVFWTSKKDTKWKKDEAGISISNGITIASGYTNQRKLHGGEEEKAPETPSVPIPNTSGGSSSSNNSGVPDKNNENITPSSPNKDNPSTAHSDFLLPAMIISIILIILGVCGKKLLDRR